MKVVGLFAGIGGIELGLESEGHETLLLCEKDPQARAVLSARFPAVPLHDDVVVLEHLPEGSQVVAAGFPCQDLSQAGRTEGINGGQSGLVAHLFRLLERSDVPHVLIENVPFMLRLERGRAMEYLVTRLEDLGFSWAYRVVDSRAFGLPHRRRRVFLLASRTGDPAQALFEEDVGEPRAPSHEGRACGFYWTEGNRGLGWAVDAIPPLKGGSGLGIPSAPAIWFPDGRVATPDIRDAERLQGFEPGWTLAAATAGRPSARWKLVGNAVSVPVAAWIGEKLHSLSGEASTHPGEPMGKRWPDAAWGEAGRRFEIDVSSWPRAVRSPSLESFLSFPPKPLSKRATSGFYGRLTKSCLSYPEAFSDALQKHVRAMGA